MEQAKAFTRKYGKLIAFVVIILVMMILDRSFGWTNTIKELGSVEGIGDYVQEHLFLSSLIYIGLTMVSCVFLSVPGVTFAVIAGLLFGPWLGTALCSISTTLGAMGSFLAGRFFLKDSIEPLVKKNRYIRKWLFDESGKNELFVLMITRLVPLFPFNLQNYAYGITSIRFSTYSVFSLLFMLPGTAMYTIGTAGLADRENRILYLLIAVAIAVLVFSVSAVLKKRYFKADELGQTEEFAQTENLLRPATDGHSSKREEVTAEASRCTSCGKCTKSCPFLEKYQLTIGDTERLYPLAYHCFLCGKCTEVCPEGIDGRGLILKMRQDRSEKNEDCVDEKGMDGIIREKKDYTYRNDAMMILGNAEAGKDTETAAESKEHSVLFPGCNFTAYYPKTTRHLLALMADHGIGTYFDCCGKPIGELGLEKDEKALLDGIRKRLEDAGITELITVCPNCHYYLKEHLGMDGLHMVSIYEKLLELGIEPIELPNEATFLPCSDRASKDWWKLIQTAKTQTENSAMKAATQANCCGLGGCAFKTEKAISKEFGKKLAEANPEGLSVYCASCAGKIRRSGGADVSHILCAWLGIDEKPEVMGAIKNKRYFSKMTEEDIKGNAILSSESREKSEQGEKKVGKYWWLKSLAIVAVLAAFVLLYLYHPTVNSWMNSIAKMFYSGDFAVLEEFVASYGAWAAAISFLLMILQSIAAPLPAFVLTLANANLFGWVLGAILSWSSAMAGASVCFFLARGLGRDAVVKLTSKAGLEQIDRFFERYGRNTILICRLLPFVSFDIVSYAAGLTSMSFTSFFIATGIGQLPATIVYSYVGHMLTGGSKMLVLGLFIMFALAALIFLIKALYNERHRKQED